MTLQPPLRCTCTQKCRPMQFYEQICPGLFIPSQYSHEGFFDPYQILSCFCCLVKMLRNVVAASRTTPGALVGTDVVVLSGPDLIWSAADVLHSSCLPVRPLDQYAVCCLALILLCSTQRESEHEKRRNCLVWLQWHRWKVVLGLCDVSVRWGLCSAPSVVVVVVTDN